MGSTIRIYSSAGNAGSKTNNYFSIYIIQFKDYLDPMSDLLRGIP